MKRIRKFMCCMTMCAVLCMTACGGNDRSEGNTIPEESSSGSAALETEKSQGAEQKPGQNQSQGREWVYVPEVFSVGEGYADYDHMQPVGDTFCYVLQGADTGESSKSICRYSLTDEKLTSVPLEVSWPDGENNWDRGVRFFGREQELYMTANVYPADYSRMSRFLCKFDREGNCLFLRDITEQAGRDVSLDRLTVDEQGRLYLFVDNGEILLYTGDGEYHGSVSYSSPDSPVPAQVKGACDGADGKYYVCISRESPNMTEEISCTLLEIDFEETSLQEAATGLPDMNGLCPGRNSTGQSGDSVGAYDFLLYDDRAVYGYNLSAQKSGSGSLGEELFTWMDSDINGYCVTNLYLLDDGRLCATVADWRNNDNVIVALTRTRAEEAPQRENLVIVTVDGESDLAAMAVKFNRGNSRYHLTVKKYESLTDLYNAVLTKEPMDLVDLSGINVQRLAQRGLLEDLSPYVERSEALGPADFVDGILDVYTFDNMLAGIPAAFSLRTVAGDRSRLDNQEGLTLEELLASGERYSGVRTFDGITKEEMMQYIMMFNEDSFIDWNTGVCHFDSEEFLEVLAYVNGFPDFPEKEDEDAPSLPTKIQNGEVLYAITEMDSLDVFQALAWMFGEDAACIGFPTPEGRGGHLLFTDDAYAIAAVSEHKEGAWNFMEEFLSSEKSADYYKSENNFFSTRFPTLKRTLDEKVEESIEAAGQIPADKFPIYIYSDGSGFQSHALTWDEVNVILDLVPDATPFFSVEGDEIIKIISEEAAAYYSGHKSAEAAADIIQNRVQLYVDENR